MDAFELLKADHKKVAELFDLLERASGKRKLDVFKRIKSELEVHTHIEETILYPALEKPEETHDLTLEAYEEHKVVKTLLAELSGAKSANDKWQAKAKVLQENIEHHVDEEEGELFKKADDALSDEEIEVLGDRMAAEKARKQGRPVAQPSGKSAGERTDTKPGIISKIAEFVGLARGAGKKTAQKAPAAKKRAAAKSSPKTSLKTKSSARASKSGSSTAGSKRRAGSKSTSAKNRAADSSGKASKTKARRRAL